MNFNVFIVRTWIEPVWEFTPFFNDVIVDIKGNGWNVRDILMFWRVVIVMKSLNINNNIVLSKLTAASESSNAILMSKTR